jgi:hypothetical protein
MLLGESDSVRRSGSEPWAQRRTGLATIKGQLYRISGLFFGQARKVRQAAAA